MVKGLASILRVRGTIPLIASRQGSAMIQINSSPLICSFHSFHLKCPVPFSSLHGKNFWPCSALHSISFPSTLKPCISWHLPYSYPKLGALGYPLYNSASRSLLLLFPLPEISFPHPFLSGYLLLILQVLALMLPPQIISRLLPPALSDLCLL